MKYDLYFNHLRNAGYIFKFNREFRKVYDLYFKYIPVYEIFVHVLKDVEISRQADKIKPASFLYSFINALGIKNKKVDDILIEILKDHTSTHELSRLIDSGRQEIINISEQFLKDIEILKKGGKTISDDAASSILREIDKNKKLVQLGKPQDIDINTTKNKHADVTLVDVHPIFGLNLEVDRNTDTTNFSKLQSTIDYLFNEISITFGLKTLENSQENEMQCNSIKNIELTKKGRLLEDKQINATNEITINKQIAVEAEHYRDDIVYTHFFTKMLETYYREIKFGFKHGLEMHGNELNNLYKNYLYDVVHDLSFFITHKDVEYEGNIVRKMQFYTYSTFGADIVVVGTIPVESDLIEIKEGQYYQVDYHKKGKIIDGHQVSLTREIITNELQDSISSEKEILIDTIKVASAANKNIFNNSMQQIEVDNENISNIKFKQVARNEFDIIVNSAKDTITGDIDTSTKKPIIITVSDLDTYYTNILHWIDSVYEADHHKYNSVDSLKRRGVIIDDNQVNIRRETNIYSLLDVETIGINIETKELKDVIVLGSDIIISPTKSLNTSSDEIRVLSLQAIDNSIEESFNSGLLNVHVEKLSKAFDGHEETSTNGNPIEVSIHDAVLTDQPSSDIIINTEKDASVYDNDAAVHRIISVAKSNKTFDDYTSDHINIPLIEVIVNKPTYIDKSNKIFDYYDVDNINLSVVEVIIAEINFGEKTQKLMDDYYDYFIYIESNEINKYNSNYIEKDKKQLDGYDDAYFSDESIEILLENIIFGEKSGKIFNEYDDNYFIKNNQDILIIDSQLIERQEKQFDDYVDKYYAISDIEIFIDDSNNLIEGINKQFDNYDIDCLTIDGREYSKNPLINVEIASKEFNDYNSNEISMSNFDIYTSEGALIEKLEKGFLIVDVENQNITELEISKHIFLIVETKDKEFITSLDDEYLNVSTEDITTYLPSFIEVKSKDFDDYQENNTSLSETVVYQNKMGLIEKLNNQLNDYDVEWHIIVPANLQKSNIKTVEKTNKSLNDYDISEINVGYSEVIVETLPYLAESVSRMFDSYVDENVDPDELETKIIQQTVLVKKEKELDYDEIENVVLDNIDVLFPGIKIIEKAQKVFDNYEDEYISTPAFDTIIISNKHTEKLTHQFDDFDSNNLLIRTGDISKLTPLFTEKINKELDDYDIENLSYQSKGINNWIIQHLEKVNKTFDEYYSGGLDSLGVEINGLNFDFIEKTTKMFDEYDIDNINYGSISTNNQGMILVEKDNKILDLLEEDYQSNLDIEVIIKPQDSLENFSREFDNIDFNSVDDKEIEIINISLELMEKSSEEFNNYDDTQITGGNINVELYEPKWAEKVQKEFNDFIDRVGSLTASEIDKGLSEELEKLRKEFNDYSDKYFSRGEIQITKLNSEDAEKSKKEFYDFLDKYFSSGGYNMIIHDHNGLEKKSKELEIYTLGQGGSGNIDIHDHNPTSPDVGWLTKKEKELEEFNDKHLHRVAVEIAYNIPDGETNPHRTLDEALIEIIGSHNVKSNSSLSVEQVFIEVVTDSHKKFFDATFTETLDKIYRNHVEMFKDEVGKNKYIGIELPKNETLRRRNRQIELFTKEIRNQLINYKKTMEIKSLEGHSKILKWVDSSQQDLSLSPKIKGTTKKSFETWKTFKDAILGNKQILTEKQRWMEENELKSEINDIIDETLDWINLAKKEAVIHALTHIEQDAFSDEIEDIGGIDFTSTEKREIVEHKPRINEQDIFSDEIEEFNPDFVNTAGREIITARRKHFEQNDEDDEIEDFDLIDFVNYDKMEINLHNIKPPVDDTFINEIEEIDTIVHVTREKVDALVHTQKLIDKMKIDAKPNKHSWTENRGPLEADVEHLKDLEIGVREVEHKHPEDAETGKRGFDPRLEDWWSQDWVFLTERKTPMGEVIEMRESAIRDFKNFMDRCIAFKDPIKGEELDELVYRWSVNTDYDINYVNEIEHFYYLIHTKLGKNNYYAKGQLELITNIIIENYKKFYVDEFKKYHFELVDPNEEVRIRLRAMLHFYMFLEQLIDANEGYLRVCTVQEGIDLIKKILREWIESETSHFQPTEEELEQLDPWIAKRIRENLPKDYVYLVRWFEWYCKEEEFVYGHNFTKDGFTAVSNVRDKMISYFNTHWGVRRTNHMDELDKLQVEVEKARQLFQDGLDEEGIELTIAMNKVKNLIKPPVLVDRTVVDKLRGMMHGKMNRIDKRFNINGLGSIQRSSLVGWRGMNKHDKNKLNTWTNQDGERYGNLKDSYNIDQHSLVTDPDYNTMIYNIVKIEKIEE